MAWAITVHKSQGLTFEKAILDVNRAFAAGQVYVALSRLKSLDGLILTAPIQFASIKQDDVLVQYSDNKPATKEIADTIEFEKIIFIQTELYKTYNFSDLYFQIKTHSESYDKTEERSNKQKHKDWVIELFKSFEVLKQNADKFGNQLHGLFQNQNSEFLETLASRNQSAKNYFYPILISMSKNILSLIESLKDEKQIKTYLTELLELESFVFKQTQAIDKVTLILNNIISNTEFSKQQFKLLSNQSDRLQLVRDSIVITKKSDGSLLNPTNTLKSNSVKKVKKNSPVKKVKVDTKLESFNLFKEGNTMFEIAKKRNLTEVTIANHLAYYVSLGMIPVAQFVSKEKCESIIQLSKKHDTEISSALKLVLGDNYTYSEIKFALATQKHLKKL